MEIKKRPGVKFIAQLPDTPGALPWNVAAGPGGRLYFAHPQHKPLVIDTNTGALSTLEPEKKGTT